MEKSEKKQPMIRIRGANENNLKSVDLDIPRNQFIVFTGLSGSGKSSLAFDTIYAEGQRRYMESLSSYARQFLGQMEKPDVESIEGLPPAISIDQKSNGDRNVWLFQTFIRESWDRTLSEVRKSYQKTDGRSDGRCDHAAAGSYQNTAACTGCTWKKGNAREVAGKSEKKWLCTCADRRQHV